MGSHTRARSALGPGTFLALSPGSHSLAKNHMEQTETNTKHMGNAQVWFSSMTPLRMQACHLPVPIPHEPATKLYPQTHPHSNVEGTQDSQQVLQEERAGDRDGGKIGEIVGGQIGK